MQVQSRYVEIIFRPPFRNIKMSTRRRENCLFILFFNSMHVRIIPSIFYVDVCRLVYKLRSVNLFSRLEHIICDKYNERFPSMIRFHTQLKG